MRRNGCRDLKRPVNKGQGHSFWYQIDFSYVTSYRLTIVTFASGVDALFSSIHNVTDRRQGTDCRPSISATAKIWYDNIYA